jgi:hypothetical protein
MKASGKLVMVIAAYFIAIVAIVFSIWQGTMDVNTAVICLVVVGEGTYIEYLLGEKNDAN